MPVTTKRCVTCKAIKPLAKFGYCDSARRWRRSRCEACCGRIKREALSDSKRLANNRRTIARAKRNRRTLDGWAAHITLKMKYKAAKRGLPFLLTADDVIDAFPVDGLCPALGMQLTFGPTRPSSASIDRIRPEYGYVAGNIRVISVRANAIKQNATADEIESVSKWLRSEERSSAPMLVAPSQDRPAKREDFRSALRCDK